MPTRKEQLKKKIQKERNIQMKILGRPLSNLQHLFILKYELNRKVKIWPKIFFLLIGEDSRCLVTTS